jgi:hypothetical protein
MAEMSNYLENALLNATLNGTTYTAPANVYVSLWTTDPTDAGSGSEVSGNGYARTEITFATASGTSGQILNDAAVEFPQATGSWGTVAYFGINDNSSGGNLLYHSPLTTSKAIDTGDIFKFAVGSVSVTLA